MSKLGELVDGRYRIVSQQPIVVPERELGSTYGMSADEVRHAVRAQLRAYRKTLPDDRRHLLERFRIVDTARKVDMKGSATVETMAPYGLTYYARLCGWTLARAHARSGDPVAIAEYLGGDATFDNAITDFSERYADQNEKDFGTFVKVVRSGRLQAIAGV